ncbi:MAG: rRNA maturation RNase YbeY [Oscillospiraceae bacterium]|jgi:probable rRNA maturation factor|nr:rRNA maturation RNase YbeY [Oscillospiraceae bacterium]
MRPNPDIVTRESAKAHISPRKAKRLLRRCVKTALREVGGGSSGNLCVLLTDDGEMRGLNGTFRGTDAPTDVLSFPADTPGEPSDIAISAERAKAQADAFGHSLSRELGYLAVHAVLHILGYTHDDEDGGRIMRGKEEEIMAKLRLPR